MTEQAMTETTARTVEAQEGAAEVLREALAALDEDEREYFGARAKKFYGTTQELQRVRFVLRKERERMEQELAIVEADLAAIDG